VRDDDGEALAAALAAGGYVSDADGEIALKMIRPAIRWYAIPGVQRLSRGRRDRGPVDAEAEAAFREQAGRFTLPPETMLIRRMHVLVAVVLTRLRAEADWGAIAAEYLHGEPPATPLGAAEAEFGARP
jgi:hypothetical protein